MIYYNEEMADVKDVMTDCKGLISDVVDNIIYGENIHSKVESSIDLHKYIYARHETYLPEGEGEADLQTEVDCIKNPGHNDFIPVDLLQIDHLPESFRHESVLAFIQILTEFTVKITVRMTSPHRPEFWEGTAVPYPNFNLSNRTSPRVGSGSIRSVYKYIKGLNEHGFSHRRLYAYCTCGSCRESETPRDVWWEIEVMTSTHVVFDDLEASHTRCTLFYDRSRCPVVNLYVVSVDYANVETDKCWLRCVTCDVALIDRLDKMYREYDQAWQQLFTHFSQSGKVDKLAFIVSHPHGCPKQVSIGEWRERIKLDHDEHLSAYTYITSTCPGTSGATVYILGYHNGQRYMYSDHHAHVGVSDNGLNYCGNGFDD